MNSQIQLLILAAVLAIWSRIALEALSRLSWVTIRKDSFKRTGLSERAKSWLERVEPLKSSVRFIMSVSLCLTAALAYPLLAVQLATWSVGAVALLTAALVSVVFYMLVELLVVSGLGGATSMLMRVAAPLLGLASLACPVLGLVDRNKRTRTDGSEEEENGPTVEEEIIHLVEQDAYGDEEESELEDSERQMIRGIFDLDETLVKEIMTPRVDMDVLKEDLTVQEAKRRIVECGHSRIPVYGETVDDIKGVIYAKDLLDDDCVAAADSLVSLVHKPLFVPESKNVRDLLDDFKRNSIHFAVIIDEYGGTAGIVTFEDILEEIVGEIRDEYDDEEDLVFQQQEDGSYVIDARTPVGKVNEFFKSEISEEEDFDTLGGFAISEFGRIPAVGESIDANGLGMTILEANERCVNQVAVKQLIKEDEA